MGLEHIEGEYRMMAIPVPIEYKTISLPGGKVLYVGGMELCTDRLAPTIHACKFPCFWKAVGNKQPQKDDENYLATGQKKDDGTYDLFLNLIDPVKPLFYIESFTVAFKFLDLTFQLSQDVAIHCNQGQSRSASIAFLWLVRRGILPDDWDNAAMQFLKLYSTWEPGLGILEFMSKNWKELTCESSN